MLKHYCTLTNDSRSGAAEARACGGDHSSAVKDRGLTSSAVDHGHQTWHYTLIEDISTHIDST